MSKRERAVRWVVVLVPALALYFIPAAGLNAGQRHLLAIFVATIIAQVAQPVPMGVSVVTATTMLVLTGTLSSAKALSGFSNATVWMVFTAFLFARAITATHFGLRIAYLFIRRFGHNALTLGYSVAASDVTLAPFVPSDTARGGGIIYPIARSLAQVFESEPGPTAGRIGSYLMLVAFHTTYTASAMFLTGMVSNPLIAEFARKIAHVELSWITWALAAIVPGLLTLTIVPYLLYRLNPPEIRDTRQAQRLAIDELHRMGPLSSRERRLIAILAGIMIGWITSPWHGLPNAFVALSGLSAILLFGVITWDDLLRETAAWNALIWFAPLIMMADALTESGVIRAISESSFVYITRWPWPAAAAAVVIGYLYVHYGFASMTAHVTALYPGFLAAGLAAGAPPMLVALALAFFSNLDAGITHYGTGSAPVYFGAGYVSQTTWWRLGLIISVVNLIIWLGIGPVWWRVLRLW
ncbi:MAG TPA: DASS family sodium-coupled anion symporter [Bryobacteraceae bacterium]|nr:DASS family sodium-coupled anion symporter [Bryobacteraceae bacterium]